LQVHQWLIQSKQDLDVILQVTMCACILHNLLINHAIPQEWMDNSMELEEDKSPVMLISTMPAVLIAACCQPIDQD